MYEAEIEEIDRENGTAAVTFSGYGNAEVIPLQNLKAVEDGRHMDDGKSKSKYVATSFSSRLVSFTNKGKGIYNVTAKVERWFWWKFCYPNFFTFL